MPDPGGSRVVLHGLNEANRDMRRWAAQVGEEVERDSRSLAEHVADSVAAKVPVLTGTLAATADFDEIPEDGWGVSLGGGGAEAYVGWIEFGGSRGRAAIPEGRYLYPTAREAEHDFIDLADRAATDSVRSFPW